MRVFYSKTQTPNVKFYAITDKESSDPSRSTNGGEYDFGRTLVVIDGQVVAGRYWTSAEFDYNHAEGGFNDNENDFSFFDGETELVGGYWIDRPGFFYSIKESKPNEKK